LQTNRGIEWWSEANEEQMPPYCEPDISDHVLDDYVMTAAADWTNERIRSYLDSDNEFD